MRLSLKQCYIHECPQKSVSCATVGEIPQRDGLTLFKTLYLHSGQSYMVVVCRSQKEYTLSYFLKYVPEVRRKASLLSRKGSAHALLLLTYCFLHTVIALSCLHAQCLL